MFASVCSICLNWWMVRDFIVLCHHLVYLAFMMFMVITESRENTSSSLWHPQGFNESGIQDLGLVHTHGGGTSQRASEYKKMNDTFLRTLLGGQQRVMTTSERRNKRGRNSALTHVNIRARRQKKSKRKLLHYKNVQVSDTAAVDQDWKEGSGDDLVLLHLPLTTSLVYLIQLSDP